MRALAIDVGSSSVRAGVVDETGEVRELCQRRLSVRTQVPGEVELDADEIARSALEVATQVIERVGPVDVVGVTNQRATTVLFDAVTGRAVGPALSWQDLRTVLDCLVLQADGVRLAPNQSATKLRWLLRAAVEPLGQARFATIETWVAWHLTRGSAHVSDHSNAAITGLVGVDVTRWDDAILDVLEIDKGVLPRIVPTAGSIERASALPGAPLITALVGDQPASLFGQSCLTKGTKVTFGTGAMLNAPRGSWSPRSMTRFESGCFPIVARSDAAQITWGLEGIALSAGSAVDWAVHGLGLARSVEATSELAASVDSSGGVTFVPAQSGLGTPRWDFGARSAFFGLTRGSSRAHLVRAVLEGVAQRGADLVDAAISETGSPIDEVRVDGGMTDNAVFLQALADATGLLIAVSPEREATTRGAGLMALLGAGHLSVGDVEALWRPVRRLEPRLTPDERLEWRARWSDAVERAARTIPSLSDVQF